MKKDYVTLIEPRPSANFVETPLVADIIKRALSYVSCGYAVNFSGPSGGGKTTLALHLAGKLGRPVVLLHGDDQLKSSDLVGGMRGYRHRRVVDNFISSVMKTEESMTQSWVDSRLTTACRYGYTLVYDEFTRSRPEANNVLLQVLEEQLLPLPAARGRRDYLQVDPNFRAIFTSNPEEYAGVHRSQDALRDRMISIHLGYYDESTEVDITCTTGISRPHAEYLVKLVRSIRDDKRIAVRPTVRACIAIGKVLMSLGGQVDRDDPTLRTISKDVLGSHLNGDINNGVFDMVLEEHFQKELC